MSKRTFSLAGGLGALTLGLVCIDFFPPLGLLELCAAVVVLFTRSPISALISLLPTGLILTSALSVMITVSGWGNPLMWPIVIMSVITLVLLILGSGINKKRVNAPGFNIGKV